ncbi:redoxin domain-containing protein [Geoalkalibacter sp.]|uniref:redoxin domain-containing protein n=1 Tax=Geoalkalibacter sp. TaxID=3041440 RepID=UPI00272E6112|nr:redoxin domain-containing protein [Geoalkalibacter sp.]
MEGHQRNLYLYDRFNARVAGVSRDQVATLEFWAKDLGLTFPLFSNPIGHLGIWFGALRQGYPMFNRTTVIIDKWGVIRYMRDGSPDYHEILRVLKQLHGEEAGR